jgi:hypothetical protein
MLGTVNVQRPFPFSSFFFIEFEVLTAGDYEQKCFMLCSLFQDGLPSMQLLAPTPETSIESHSVAFAS